MIVASGVLAVIGAAIVAVAVWKQTRLDPDDPKYNIGSGVAVTPPSRPLGGSYLGARRGAQILHVSIPGAKQLVLDQCRLTLWVALGAAIQLLAVIAALVASAGR